MLQHSGLQHSAYLCLHLSSLFNKIVFIGTATFRTVTFCLSLHAPFFLASYDCFHRCRNIQNCDILPIFASTFRSCLTWLCLLTPLHSAVRDLDYLCLHLSSLFNMIVFIDAATFRTVTFCLSLHAPFFLASYDCFHWCHDIKNCDTLPIFACIFLLCLIWLFLLTPLHSA